MIRRRKASLSCLLCDRSLQVFSDRMKRHDGVDKDADSLHSHIEDIAKGRSKALTKAVRLRD